jgi:2-iminobutanoate/2-iminopropanoate deaminase
MLAKDAPKPNGHYSHVRKSNSNKNVYHFCGFMGDDPASGTIVDGGLEKQAIQAMKNCQAALDAAGCHVENVVRRRIYIVNMKPDDIKTVDGIVARAFKEPYPVSVRRSRHGCFGLRCALEIVADVVC